ncbi:rRNA-processing protein BFR2 [Lachancea thermotolerans CBS 6340]|uniref:Protein BFR2 n=1 Tax=Lachancea thermotolerans (strain ATCC 56472 / CBS 6340 / NRRL Y-8284) TaxID=559295 RepID=C5DM52_LACTC|nr:KLTH0G06050p [Lachancea thermotolerans CBS 6340]CAR24863.1 KLTH0G06050p [Lachancea thermotolerans CBS 6340]
MAKSISDQIAAIANEPAVPDYDIEDEDVFQHREHSGDELSESEDDTQAKSHYVSVGKSRLRDQGIALKDEKYSGQKGSRKALSEGQSEGESEVDSESEIESESESEIETENKRRGSEPADESDGSSNSESDGKSDDGGDSESSEDSADEGVSADQGDERRRRLAALVQRDARDAVARLSDTTRRDAAKGLAVLQQTREFDRILDARIKLQKAVAAANRLPVSAQAWDGHLRESETNAALLSETMRLLEKVLAQTLDFRAELQDAAPTGSDAAATRKRTFSDLCEDSRGLDAKLREFRVAVLSKWSQRVAAASGQSVLAASKFKAIHQPAHVQVETQLADMPRLLRRTALNRRDVAPLGQSEHNIAGGGDVSNDTPAISDGPEPDIPRDFDANARRGRTADTTTDSYVFDDEDFYRVLLNDLVDKKVAGASGDSAVAITSRATANKKLHKNVDTKASKGRKLNFTVQEPIANYEAPANGGLRWSDEQIDEFCAGLLGQRVSFAEDEKEEDRDATEETADGELLQADGIRLFG